MGHWLMKSEPDAFGIDDLAKRPKQTEPWNGVRNYQARNFMRDGMNKGDLAFFYHSSCAEPGIAGIVEIARAAYPDPTARNPESPYYDPRASADNPYGARVIGTDVRRVYAIAFGIGAACVGAAGALTAPVLPFSPAVGLPASVTSFNIVIIGGMGSLVGALLGGLLVSVAESLGAVFLKPSLKELVSFSLLIVILLLRPAGLFGKRAT